MVHDGQPIDFNRVYRNRLTETAVAPAVVDCETARIVPPFEPRQVFLFSGHRIDAPDRPTPRFPVDKEPIAAEKIAAALDACGTTHMYNAVKRRTGRVTWLDTRVLW